MSEAEALVAIAESLRVIWVTLAFMAGVLVRIALDGRPRK